jgi:hypothetical protein
MVISGGGDRGDTQLVAVENEVNVDRLALGRNPERLAES